MNDNRGAESKGKAFYWLPDNAINITNSVIIHIYYPRLFVTMLNDFFPKLGRFIIIVLICSVLSACQQRVILIPGENDLVVLNGCVVSACNYLAVVETQHRLEPNFWAKVLLVRFDNHPAGHAYCVWETDGTIYGYDRNSGGFPIPVYTRDARAIAIVLALGLSKIMKEPLSVRSAEFVEPTTAELYKFSQTTPPGPAAQILADLSVIDPRKLTIVSPD